MMLRLQDIKVTGWFNSIMGKSHGGEAISPVTLKPYNIYTSINDLPFSAFKRLTIDEDLDALIMSGYDRLSYREIRQAYDKITLLEEARDKIKEQFEERMGGDDLREFVGAAWGLETLNARIKRLKDNLTLFMQFPTETLVQMFTDEGFVYSTDDLNAYAHYIRNRIASLETKFESQRAVYEKHYKSDEAFTPTHEYYEGILLQISKMEGREISDNMSTLRFCLYVNQLRAHYERLKQQDVRYT